MTDLSSKVAIVTGASRGIGACTAQLLGSAGASVVVNYLKNRDKAENVVNAVKQSGGSAIAVQADVGNPADIARLFDEAISAYGKVDILINNAGDTAHSLIKDTSEEDFDYLYRLNVKGVFFGMREAANRLEDYGRVINLSSSVTRSPMPAYGVYSSSKAAVENMTPIFAKEVGERGITVNTVIAGITDTDLFRKGKTDEVIDYLISLVPLGRLGQPRDIAETILFLVSEEGGWVNGQCIGVNGGIA